MDDGNARELADPPLRSAARIIAQVIRFVLATALMIFATANIEARTDQSGPRG